MTNHNLLLITGESTTGKSASLKDLKDPQNVWYGNCENNKELPFKSEFREMKVTDPLKLPGYLTKAEESENIHTAVIDTITYLMEMYETQIVNTAPNKMAAWGKYGDYFRDLMNLNVAEMTKNVIMLGHTADIPNEKTGEIKTKVKVKGALMNQGIESRFTNVISTKLVTLKSLEGFENDLLNITEDDEVLGFKYVFQTRITKDTVHEAIRGPMGLWERNETFIDNNAQNVLDRLHAFYN